MAFRWQWRTALGCYRKAERVKPIEQQSGRGFSECFAVYDAWEGFSDGGVGGRWVAIRRVPIKALGTASRGRTVRMPTQFSAPTRSNFSNSLLKTASEIAP